MRVLDLGSGEGYGTSLLARKAGMVVGLELDPTVAADAQKKYDSSNLHFVAGSGVQIPFIELFDVVVCLETLGHVDNRGGLIREVKRLLKPDGLLIVSTRDSDDDAPYDEAFSFEEFRKLLESTFRETQFLGQRVYPSSSIWPVEGTGDNPSELLIEKSDSQFRMAGTDRKRPSYYMALTSDANEGLRIQSSVLIDCSNELINQGRSLIDELREELRKITEERAEALAWKNSQVGNLEAAIESGEKAVEWLQSQARSLEESNQWWKDQAGFFGEQLDREHKEASTYIESLERTLSEKNLYISRIEADLNKAKRVVQELADIKAARAFVVFTKLREIRRFLFGS